MNRPTACRRRRFGAAALVLWTLAQWMASVAPARAGETLLESVTVDPRSSSPTRTTHVLQSGKTYRIEVTGKYFYSVARQLVPGAADAECSTGTNGSEPSVWRTTRYNGYAGQDQLDLYVNGARRDWLPAKGTEYGNRHSSGSDALCSQTNTYTLTAPSSWAGAPLSLMVWNDDYSMLNQPNADNPTAPTGLAVKLFALGDEIAVAAATINSASPAGAFAQNVGASGNYSFLANKTYRIEASGTFYFTALPTYRGDAECAGNGHWSQNEYGVALTPTDPFDDPLDLYIGGAPVEWTPRVDDGQGCNLNDHVYTYEFVPAATGPVRFAVSDTNYNDNSGTVQIAVFLLPIDNPPGGGATPDPGETANTARETAETAASQFTTVPDSDAMLGVDLKETQVATAVVDGASHLGTTVTGLLAGRTYRVEATGTYEYTNAIPDGTADAECSRTAGNPEYVTDRYGTITIGDLEDDPLDLYVDETPLDWAPTVDTGNGCNADDHTYSTTFVAGGTDAVMRVYELPGASPQDNYLDNAGTLSLTIFRVDEEVVETLVLDSANPSGATTAGSLDANQAYRFLIAGTYQVSVAQVGQLGSVEGDAECTRTGLDPTWRPDRYVFNSTDYQDVLVEGIGVDWASTLTGLPGCNASTHTYQLAATFADEGPVNFRVLELSNNNFDNSGLFVVRVIKVLN